MRIYLVISQAFPDVPFSLFLRASQGPGMETSLFLSIIRKLFQDVVLKNKNKEVKKSIPPNKKDVILKTVGVCISF